MQTNRIIILRANHSCEPKKTVAAAAAAVDKRARSTNREIFLIEEPTIATDLMKKKLYKFLRAHAHAHTHTEARSSRNFQINGE